MLKTILIILLIFVIVWIIFKLFIRKRRDNINLKSKSKVPMSGIETTQDNSRSGTCKSCGQRRIIMNEGMCAYCWSTSQTQGLK
jgi:hypothetical protein